jgi:murein DD-endopeptidase MepM/ murein hydrolase activator NlpD
MSVIRRLKNWAILRVVFFATAGLIAAAVYCDHDLDVSQKPHRDEQALFLERVTAHLPAIDQPIIISASYSEGRRWPKPKTLLIRIGAQKAPPADDAVIAFEKLLSSTGLDVKALLKEIRNSSAGEGGPYIALRNERITRLDDEQLSRLRNLANNLPLGSPLDAYQLSSGYGARIDPINHDPAFHPGLDMVAPYRTAVYSTARGTVVFAGNIDGYGHVVEIDHGHGIITRYAHLHRILVAQGQTVEAHAVVGELGSTGRSTAPHLHYEIRMAGAPLDPAKFIQLGGNAVEADGGGHLTPMRRGTTIEAHAMVGELGAAGRSSASQLHYELHLAEVSPDPAKFIQLGGNAVAADGGRHFTPMPRGMGVSVKRGHTLGTGLMLDDEVSTTSRVYPDNCIGEPLRKVMGDGQLAGDIDAVTVFLRQQLRRRPLHCVYLETLRRDAGAVETIGFLGPLGD